jgi:hypothetical protein
VSSADYARENERAYPGADPSLFDEVPCQSVLTLPYWRRRLCALMSCIISQGRSWSGLLPFLPTSIGHRYIPIYHEMEPSQSPINQPRTLRTSSSLESNIMKEAILALAIAAVSLGAVAPASADSHHRSCHKVMVHHHWQNRCR